MNPSMTRRDLLKTAAVGCAAAVAAPRAMASLRANRAEKEAGWISGQMTGAQALVESLLIEGVECVFGIPGAQDNELWDTMKSKGLPYLLVTHEFSAACMADGYARTKGKPGVLCVVPGPGVTNALSGIGEALLDSIPLVCIVCDVARGDKYKAFQVHELPQVGLLKPITKEVYEVSHQAEIPTAVRQALVLARSGEPGPVAVVVPYPLFIATHKYHAAPPAPPEAPFDDAAVAKALQLLSNRKLRVGVYAGLGCMDYTQDLTRAAELLQAPVATSVSGKGAIPDNHPLAVGWGYGPQATRTAEAAFKDVDLVLALGVRYSEVSTGFYAIPKTPHLIHVDANANNLGRNVKPDVCVHADAGLFLTELLHQRECLQRPCDAKLAARIQSWKREECKINCKRYETCGVDPMALVLALRRCLREDALLFMDVSQTEHWAAEAFTTLQPRTYFNPTNNQVMGWSIPAALGAQRVHPGRQVATITGDGCFLMTAMEVSTAAREALPVKFFVLDDQAFHYMQSIQKPAYLRTTATILAKLDYAALAKGFGVGYQELDGGDLEAGVRGALCQEGPVLVRVIADYGKRPVRWIDAVHDRYTKELSTEQKVRFLARIGSRKLTHEKEND
jgi:acetolactate synthase-1/2/3 large subunit